MRKAKGVSMNMGVCVYMGKRMSMREDASVGVNADASVGASSEGAGTWIRVMRGHGMSCLRAATAPRTIARRCERLDDDARRWPTDLRKGEELGGARTGLRDRQSQLQLPAEALLRRGSRTVCANAGLSTSG